MRAAGAARAIARSWIEIGRGTGAALASTGIHGAAAEFYNNMASFEVLESRFVK
ncbi:hypothetical protein O9992_17760 [Vibrio lentus]|nr:hypothetical protein [Vibrio lentus]